MDVSNGSDVSKVESLLTMLIVYERSFVACCNVTMLKQDCATILYRCDEIKIERKI